MKFGLNQECKLTSAKVDAGRYGTQLILIFDIDGKKQYAYIGEPNGPWIKDKKIALTTKKLWAEHLIHPFTSKEKIRHAVKGDLSWPEYCEALKGCLPAHYDQIDLDIFLSYQYKKKEGKDRTFLEIPKSLKHGDIIAKGDGKRYGKIIAPNYDNDTEEALYYMAEADEKHPFTRNGWFMDSNFAQAIGDEIAETRPPDPDDEIDYNDDLPF